MNDLFDNLLVENDLSALTKMLKEKDTNLKIVIDRSNTSCLHSIIKEVHLFTKMDLFQNFLHALSEHPNFNLDQINEFAIINNLNNLVTCSAINLRSAENILLDMLGLKLIDSSKFDNQNLYSFIKNEYYDLLTTVIISGQFNRSALMIALEKAYYHPQATEIALCDIEMCRLLFSNKDVNKYIDIKKTFSIILNGLRDSVKLNEANSVRNSDTFKTLTRYKAYFDFSKSVEFKERAKDGIKK